MSYMKQWIEFPQTEADHNNNVHVINQRAALHIQVIDIKPWIKNAKTVVEYANNFAILNLPMIDRIPFIKDVEGDPYFSLMK